MLQKAPLSSQAASHLSVDDGDGVHPWYMMLRRFSSRSARKWADLAARVKRVVAVLSAEYRVWVEREWWGVWSLGSISSTPGEHCIEYSRGELGNDVRGGAVHVIFCDGASKNNATGESGYESGLAHAQNATLSGS